MLGGLGGGIVCAEAAAAMPHTRADPKVPIVRSFNIATLPRLEGFVVALRFLKLLCQRMRLADAAKKSSVSGAGSDCSAVTGRERINMG
jgi:hypothetical protein